MNLVPVGQGVGTGPRTMQSHLRRLAAMAIRPCLRRRNFYTLRRPSPSIFFRTAATPIHLGQHRLISLRTIGTAVLLPKTYFFRVFWTLLTGTIGFISYQISEASGWVQEKGNMVMVSMMSLGLGIMDWGQMAKELLAGMPNLMELLPQPKTKSKPTLKPPMPEPKSNPEAAVLLTGSDDEDREENEPATASTHDHFRHFIRSMIEIRDILKQANLEHAFDLPRIVVIGSQSSGKSSVLESIVGHEFLPKGQNMVTRRPLELTLVHTPDASRDYGVFSSASTSTSNSPIYDFAQIQAKLTELNLAVPDSDWVSPVPIELRIYSKNVPDLTLIDLPGYIQISTKKQPTILRERIGELCERYIEGTNNLILAVCPADVDLANAEALKAAQRVDPHGDRTVGVITKLDLVDPSYAADLLRNEDYPLKLGYIGVVCKPTTTADLASRLLHGRTLRSDYEQEYFTHNAPIFTRLQNKTGIQSLRQVLTRTLENNMAVSLDEILHNVQEELSEVKYQLKVEFNDRIITPESYVASLLGHLKNGFGALMQDFTRNAVRHHVDLLLKQQLLQVIEQYLAEPGPTNDEAILEERFKMSVAALTKSGIGKKTVDSLVNSIISDLEGRLSDGPLSNHPQIKESLLEELSNQLRRRSRQSADMVENALKPYKDGIEFTPAEWSDARHHVLGLLEDQIRSMTNRIETIQREVGSKRLRKAIQYLAVTKASGPSDDTRPELVLTEKSLELLVKGQEVAHLNHRVKLLKRRLEDLRTNPSCNLKGTSTSGWSSWLSSSFLHGSSTSRGEALFDLASHSPCLKGCPELYLFLLHTRLLQISSLFIHHELVHESLTPLLLLQSPADTGATVASLALGAHDREAAMRYVGENGIVSRHVALIERRLALERVKDKLVYLKQRKEDDAYVN